MSVLTPIIFKMLTIIVLFPSRWTVWHYTGRPVSHEKVERRTNPRPATADLPPATEHELYQVISRPLPVDKLPLPPKVYATQHSSGDGTSKVLFGFE